MKNFFFLFITCLALVSCKDDSVKMGAVKYYPSFLWTDAHTEPLKRTLDLDFSNDAKAENSVFAEFQFVDNDGNPISTSEMQVEVNGNQLKDNKLRVNSNDTAVELIITFSPSAKEGKHQGYLRLVNHNLHRLGNTELNSNPQADAFQWSIEYNKVMNPLAKVLLWIVIVIASALCLWFIVLRPIMYPHFKKMNKTVLVKQNGQIIQQRKIKFTGNRKVVFANKQIKQSLLNRLFVGKTVVWVNPVFTTPLNFTPRKRGAMVYGNGYMVQPNPMPQSGICNVKNPNDKMEIQIM